MFIESLGGIAMIAAALVGVLVVLVLIGRVTRLYHRVPPNQVMVVYGRGKTVFDEKGRIDRSGVRLVTGGGVLVTPFIEDYGYLDLTVMTITKSGDEVYTVDGVPIRLDWVAQVQIDNEEVSLLTAARAFLGRRRDEVREVIAQTLSANFRAIVGQLTVEDVHRDRDAFVRSVSDLASDDMAAMGAVIISMGIEEITDDQGYFEAMAKPRIAAIKRDAIIAEAEADREARIKAASARREAEQAELDASRAIIEQREALDLREVQKTKTVGLAQAESEEAVQKRRAAVVKEQQEVEVLVPARAQREALEIEADAERRKLTITAQAKAEAVRTEASGDSQAIKMRGEADADKFKALRLAEAEANKANLFAEAEGSKAKMLAQADGTRANLLAEAEGKARLAEATAAEGEINLRQAIAQLIVNAEVEKMRAIGEALKGIGENVRIVQIGDGAGSRDNALLETLKGIPELATIINAKTEALSGENLEELVARMAKLLKIRLGDGTAPKRNGEPQPETAPEPAVIELELQEEEEPETD